MWSVLKIPLTQLVQEIITN